LILTLVDSEVEGAFALRVFSESRHTRRVLSVTNVSESRGAVFVLEPVFRPQNLNTEAVFIAGNVVWLTSDPSE